MAFVCPSQISTCIAFEREKKKMKQEELAHIHENLDKMKKKEGKK